LKTITDFIYGWFTFKVSLPICGIFLRKNFELFNDNFKIQHLNSKKQKQKNLKSIGCPFLICLAKEMQHIIFYVHVHACYVVPAILTRNKRHCSRFRNSVSWSCYKASLLY